VKRDTAWGADSGGMWLCIRTFNGNNSGVVARGNHR